MSNVDSGEIARFDAVADRWWDSEGEFKPLHDINPLRLEYIDRQVGLRGSRVIDVGCGGGLLAEGMTALGAEVTGIDMGEVAIEVARAHAAQSGAEVDYRIATAEDMADSHAGEFDVVTCLEMLEHVPDPAAVVGACARLLREGGHAVFSTLNRNPKSYLLAILGAEYVLNLVPRGTHDYQKFIRPSELETWAREAGLVLGDITGMQYNPLTRQYSLGRDVDVNYLITFRRSG